MDTGRDRSKKVVIPEGGNMAVWNIAVRVINTTLVIAACDQVELKPWKLTIVLN